LQLKFLIQFFCAFALYAIASHIFFPYVGVVHGILPVLVVYYFTGYMGTFLIIYFLISVPVLLFTKLFPKYRHIPAPTLLSRTLIPSLIVGAILIYGGWYGST
jgi:hypothetical protein